MFPFDDVIMGITLDTHINNKKYDIGIKHKKIYYAPKCKLPSMIENTYLSYFHEAFCELKHGILYWNISKVGD